MGTERARVLGLALACVVLIVASVLVMDWFVATGGSAMEGLSKISVDLREIHVCVAARDVCASVSVRAAGGAGAYPTCAAIAYFLAIGFGILVVAQAGIRLVQGHAPAGVSKLGYTAAAILFAVGLGCGYIVNPDLGNQEMVPGLGLHISRTFAPLLLLAGCVVGGAALYYAALPTSVLEGAATYRPLPVMQAQPPRATTPPPMSLDSQRTGPIVSRTKSRPIPDKLKGKLSFATLTAELSRAGIDARREDGESMLVMWRDLVGVVARRLPPDEPYNGTPFVDLVSTAGSTLRILPWTRLSGDPLDGDGEGDARCRAIVQLVSARCPEIHLDRATREFLAGSEPPAQLPDEATLAAHDQRLA